MHSIKLKPVPARESEPAFDDLELSTDPLPLVPPGDDYYVIVLSCRKTQKFQRNVLAFIFKIVSPGPGFGLVLPTFVNLPAGRGRNLPARSKLASWLRVINAYDPSLNLKRLSLKIFSLYQFQATIDTVLTDRNQRQLRTHEQFSKIADLTAVLGRLT